MREMEVQLSKVIKDRQFVASSFSSTFFGLFVGFYAMLLLGVGELSNGYAVLYVIGAGLFSFLFGYHEHREMGLWRQYNVPKFYLLGVLFGSFVSLLSFYGGWWFVLGAVTALFGVFVAKNWEKYVQLVVDL